MGRSAACTVTGAVTLRPEHNPTVGLVYALPLSIALWAGIAGFIHLV